MKFFPPAQHVSRGDIVVFQADQIWGEYAGHTLIKRVVAISGDTVECVNEVLKVNGEHNGVCGRDQEFRVRISDGAMFVVGDNRPVSYDSRSVGEVDVSAVAATLVTKIPF